MESSECGILQQLLTQITELNGKLQTAIASIDLLTKQVSELEIKSSTNVPATTNGHGEDIQTPENAVKPVKPRKLGYVNWESHHEKVKSQQLVKVSDLREALDMLRTIEISDGATKSTVDAKFSQGKTALACICGADEAYNENNYEDGLGNKIVKFRSVGKETRFPQDAVYIDTNLPHVLIELDFFRQINVPPTPGVVERFLNIIEQEKHTTSSFEAEHNLTWA